jgi:hypothetical protein
MVGAGLVALGGKTAAQVPTADELNARFVVSKTEHAYIGPRSAVGFRFIKDKQTGDCYIAQTPGDRLLGEMIKTDDNACSGF